MHFQKRIAQFRFKLHVPSINKFVTIYGRPPEYQTAQENFMRSFHEQLNSITANNILAIIFWILKYTSTSRKAFSRSITRLPSRSLYVSSTWLLGWPWPFGLLFYSSSVVLAACAIFGWEFDWRFFLRVFGRNDWLAWNEFGFLFRLARLSDLGFFHNPRFTPLTMLLQRIAKKPRQLKSHVGLRNPQNENKITTIL